MRALLIAALASAALLAACDDEPTPSTTADVDADSAVPDADADASPEVEVPTEVSIGEASQVVPSDRLPSEVTTQLANNNLDIVAHEGRLFFAFRTAEWHFASEGVDMVVVSSDTVGPGAVFDFETIFHLGRDLREPRFLSFDGRLFLYFAVLGTDPLDFEPFDALVSEYIAPGEWTEPVKYTFEGPEERPEGFIAWRTKTLDGVPYMVGYEGGENIYDPGADKKIRIFWMTTDDGIVWRPVIEDQPVVEEGGGSETDFAFDAQGRLIAVTRNEKGDETGWGSKICRAEPGALGDWECVHDPKKYDSPLVFSHDGRIFLIGRRNLTETGNYDLGHEEGTPEEKTSAYLIDYSSNPKRCAVWEVDPDELTVSWVFDLVSKGDTCFPGMVPIDAHHYLIYNYTSPPDAEEMSWIDGQVGPTWIVEQVLALP